MSDFFYFRKEDRKVIVTLAIIAIFCVGVMLVVNAFKSKDEPKKASALAENIMPNSNNKEEGVSKSEDDEESLAEPKASKLFAFDPNTIDSTTLVSFGIKAWKVKNFIHYRKAGKVFHSADDMLDTYGWTEEDIKPLRPYIHIGKAYQKENYTKISDSRKEHDESATPVVEKESAHKDSLRRYMSNKFKEHTLVDLNAFRALVPTLQKASFAIVINWEDSSTLNNLLKSTIFQWRRSIGFLFPHHKSKK